MLQARLDGEIAPVAGGAVILATAGAMEQAALQGQEVRAGDHWHPALPEPYAGLTEELKNVPGFEALVVEGRNFEVVDHASGETFKLELPSAAQAYMEERGLIFEGRDGSMDEYLREIGVKIPERSTDAQLFAAPSSQDTSEREDQLEMEMEIPGD